MAQNQIGNEQGFVDKRAATRAGSATDSITNNTNLDDVGSMRTRLAAISAYYTPAKLDQMTDNDMRWAIRQADEAASI